MATVVRIATYEYPNDRQVIVTWAAMDSDDEGDPVILEDYPDRCVQVLGTFGAGGSVRIAGTNDSGGSAAYSALSDPQGVALNLTAAGVKQVTEVPFRTKPIVTAGDGTTALTVKMTCRKPRA